MRRPIFIGIRATIAENLGSRKVGDTHVIGYNEYNSYHRIQGTIRKIITTPHGKLFFLVNNRDYDVSLGLKKDTPYGVHNWPLIPVWVSECGSSGILLGDDKDPEMKALIKAERQSMEDEILRYMAI